MRSFTFTYSVSLLRKSGTVINQQKLNEQVNRKNSLQEMGTDPTDLRFLLFSK